MAKIYEALRRAERERESAPLAAPLSAPVSAPVPLPPAPPAPPETPSAPTPPEASPAPDPGPPPFEPSERGGEVHCARLVAKSVASTDKRCIALLEPESFVAEQFRVLRTRLDSLAADAPLEALAITSALSGEGKSHVAINLALVIAMGVARKVVLVDCDMRRPVVHRSLGFEPDVGLAEILLDRARPQQAILPIDGTSLEVLGVRMQPPNPSELLAGPRMRDLVAELREEYDWVILDTPPTLGLPDSKIVGELCDGYLVVVRAGETPRADVEAALEALDPRCVVGLVLNRAQMRSERYAYPTESVTGA
jgi:capsular exopolysaccharide synthesis family protein